MEEAKNRGRKRKQPPPNAFTGTFTRQRSQLFLHSTRSGKSRPDPVRKSNPFPPHPNYSQIPKDQKSPRNQEDSDDPIYDVSIKDLRARRIFSKPLKPSPAAENPNLSVSDKCDSEKEGLSGENPNPNLSAAEITCDGGVDFEGEELNEENLNLLITSIGDSIIKEKEQKFDVLSPNLSERNSKRGNREDCEGFTEENVLTTPPDSVLHIKKSDDGSALQLQNRNACSRLPPKKTSPTKEKKNNMALKPCSRMKVINHYSFSYKRLLPYLKEMANETSCAPKVNPCPKNGFDKSSDETRLNGGSLAEGSDSGIDLKTPDAENLNLTLAGKCDSKEDVECEGLNGESLNLSMLDKCDSERQDDSTGEKRNSSVVGTCDRGVDFKGERLSAENPNSLLESIGVSDVKEKIFGLSVDKEVLDGVKEQKFDVGFNCIAKMSNVLSPNISDRDFKGENREDCEGFTEDNVQTTPPEAVIHIQKSDDGRSALQNRNGCSTSSPKKTSPSKEKKNSFEPKRHMGLKPCSRMKVFNPYSFSYRRLLPYLTEMATDTSLGAPKVNPCPKTRIDAGEKPPLVSSQESITDTAKFDEKAPAVLPDFSPEEVSISRKDVKGSLELKGSDLKTEQAAIETPVNCSQDKSQVNSVSPQSKAENPTENSSQKGVLPIKSVAFDHTGTSGDVSMIVKPDQVDSSIAPERSPDALRKDVDSEAQFQLALNAEREARTAHLEFKTDENSTTVSNKTAKLEAAVSSGDPADCLTKGILKRNPRGCRGICNCLNCASFHLNAGKSFEFSKNQMLDTQELVLDMMKELSDLRVMLEKSVDGSNNHSILPVDQVQEACRRASNMEDTARNRLSQMNEDLFVHCRTKSLERPRVNFSSNVQEKVIEKSTK